MSKVESNMVSLGTIAPNFELPDVSTGAVIKLEDGKQYTGTVVMFLCNHCPYVKHINAELVQLAQEYQGNKVRFIAINSNDVSNYPEDSPGNMRLSAQKLQYPFTYLFDETQEIAKAYSAACTPDFYVFDAQLALVYRGQFDDSRPGNNIPVSGNSMRKALDCLLGKLPIDFIQKPSMGCNIKWK